MTFPSNVNQAGSSLRAVMPQADDRAEESSQAMGSAQDDGDWVDLYDPALESREDGQVTVDAFTLSETEEGFEQIMCTESDLPAASDASQVEPFLPQNPDLDRQLDMHARNAATDPKPLLKFVAQNTNPNRSWFGLQNLLHILNDIIHFRRPVMVLNRNCVHCARTVDQTLAQLTAGRDGTVASRMYQVNLGNNGDFMALMGERGAPGQEGSLIGANVREQGREAFADALKERIGAGQRGCISTPVKGYSFSHAMNVVHTTEGRLFVICGQQGKVYDLNDAGDLADFWKRYGVGAEGDRTTYVVCTGEAPAV